MHAVWEDRVQPAMNQQFLHINDFFHPHIAGPTKHIEDVIHFTFRPDHHSVIAFNLIDGMKADDVYETISIRRFQPIADSDFHRHLHLDQKESGNLSDFVAYVREKRPACVLLYFIGYLPIFIRHAIPELNVIFMPFGFSAGDYRHEYRTRRFKIALCGDGAREDYLQAGARPEQIHIIERPINTNYYAPVEVKRDPFRLLCVGRFHPMKRYPALIQAIAPLFRDYPKLSLHIVADTTIGIYTGAKKVELEAVRNAIQTNGLQDRVFLRGRKVGDELIREYSEASIHLLPSNNDRRATVVQEAITMGMQCINTCRRAYDWPEYAEDGRRLIHYVDEVEDMVPVLRDLLDKGPLPSNRDYALRHWSWDIWKPAYEKLMTEW